MGRSVRASCVFQHSRLPELIGLSRALDVILTGRIIEAKEAQEMGLVNRVVKTGQAYGRAMHLAKELIAHPQVSSVDMCQLCF